MSNFEDLTGLYSLSRTVEFFAIPEPKTAEVFESYWANLSESNIDGKTNFFFVDKNLSAATETIKLILNEFHERFINYALSSDEIKNYDFTKYLEQYRRRDTDGSEEEERIEIGKIIHSRVEGFIDQYTTNLPTKKANKFTQELSKHKKDNNYCSAFSIMEMRDLLQYNPSLRPQNVSNEDYVSALEKIQGFWHTLDTFTQNRENYYFYDKEQSTSVITRIVYDLLPTYCANILLYEDRIETYNAMFSELTRLGIEMRIKNPKDNSYEDIASVDMTIFDIAKFGSTLTQKKIELYNTEVAKLNEVVNLFNQQFAGTTDFRKLKPFVSLHKQIGCKPSIVPMSIQLESFYEKDINNSANGECKSVESLIQVITDNVSAYTSEQNIHSASSFVKYLKGKERYAGMYMSDKAIETYLRKYMADAYAIKESMKSVRSCTIVNKEKPEGEQIKWNAAVELSPLFERLDNDYEFETAFKPSVYKDYSNVLNDSNPISKNIIALLCSDIEQAIKRARDFEKTTKLDYEDKNNNSALFVWLDSVLDLCRFIKSFNVPKNKIKGAELDTELMQFVEHILEPNWFGWYAAIDTFVLKKPQDDVKENQLKLNFGTSSFLKGWSEGQEKQKLSVIIKKDNLFYLCILKDKKLFEPGGKIFSCPCGNAYRMVMKKLSFRTLTGKGYVSKFGKRLREEENADIAVSNIKDLIRSKYLVRYPCLENVLDKEFSSTNEMKGVIDSILEEYSQCELVPINWEYLKEQEGKGVFILQIYNKDFSQASNGKKNLFTIYWEDLFSGNSNHRIGGEAKLFTRESAGKETDTIKHKIGSFLLNKRDRNGDVIPINIYTELYNYKNGKGELKSQQAKELLAKNLVVFKEVKEGHEIIKDRRFYSGKKYTFHCPIKFNEGAKDSTKKPDATYLKYDQLINDSMLNPTFIGIDRGEKHLVYWCELYTDGTIKDCGNFDTINGTNYVQLLDDRTNLRKKEQKERRQKSNIKNLKESYIKLVTSEVAKRAIIPTILDAKSPMYVILEKLSKEMKDKRANIEKKTYQAFETALANKLSLFVDKNISEGPASIKQPLQLVPPFKTFDDIDGKDSFGIMQYTRANYTSITDPLTGWRQSIYIQGGKSIDIIQRIIAAFDDIRFDGKDYAFDYTDDNTGKHWTLYSGINGKPLDRFYGYIKESEEQHPRVDVVEILEKLFVNFDKTKSLRNQLVEGVELKKISDSSRTAAEELRFAIKIIQQIRNTGNDAVDDNYLQSPVRDNEGRHFDTRKANSFEGLEKIKDGDANGAYNIARKGYLMYKHREYWKSIGSPTYIPDKKKNNNPVPKLNLFISDKEWDLWLQNEEEWKKQIDAFAIKKE